MDINQTSLLSTREARLVLPISSWKLIDLAKKGQVKYLRLGNKYYFHFEDLLRLKTYGTHRKVDEEITA